MPTCPSCGEDVALGATSCGACGATVGYRGPYRRIAASLLALVIIISVAALVHSTLRPKPLRSPLEFVPRSARAVIALDLRPGSAASVRLREEWSRSDRERLAGRAYDLAQRAIDWSGLQLDIRKDASKWFGGEVVAASIGAPDARSWTPRSTILIARVTDLRRARSDLDRSAKELAREEEWTRARLRSGGQTITVWGHPGAESEFAYAVADGCLLVSTNAEIVDLCLKAARKPSDRLSETAGFKVSRRGIPNDAFAWCYLDAADLLQASRELAPYLAQGWMGLVHRYLDMRKAGPVPRTSAEKAGIVAAAVTPEKDGLRAHASYVSGRTTPSRLAGRGTKQLLSLVPRDATAFAYLADLPEVLANVGQPARRGAEEGPTLYWGPLRLVVQPAKLPKSLLVAVLPREATKQPSDGKQTIALPGRMAIAVALAGGSADQTGQWLAKMRPAAKVADIAGAQVLSSDDRALIQMRAAAADESARLETEAGADIMAELWAKPGAVVPSLARIDEIGLALRRDAAGANAEIRVRAEPGYLLGSP